MTDTIQMGNDELILYIRKHHAACATDNRVLGKKIWAWIQAHDASARLLNERDLCLWGDEGSFIDDRKLPKTSASFEFARWLLPGLFHHLDELGTS